MNTSEVYWYILKTLTSVIHQCLSCQWQSCLVVGYYYLPNDNSFPFQLESDGSRSGSSLSLRNTSLTPRGQEYSGAAQSPSHSHRGVHRSVSATNSKPSRRASSGGETIRELKHGHHSGSHTHPYWSFLVLFAPSSHMHSQRTCFAVKPILIA